MPYLLGIFVNGDVLNETPTIEGDLIALDFGRSDRNDINNCNEILDFLTVEITKKEGIRARQIHEVRPWLHWDKRLDFYSRARKLERILACTIVSTNLAFIFTDPTNYIRME